MEKALYIGMILVCLSCAQNTTLNNNPKSHASEHNTENTLESNTVDTTTKETTNVSQKRVSNNTSAGNITSSSIHQKAKDIVENSKTLANESSSFLENKKNCSECPSVAVVASAAHYLNNDSEQAAFHAQKAYTLTNNRIEFLPTSQTITTDQSLVKQQKLAKAKDFIISQKNGGINDFKQGNIQFLGLAKHKNAIKHYQLALQKGLDNIDLRKECSINLAACLYRNKQNEEAKKLIVYTWLVHPNVQINVGEQATRDALKKFISNFQDMQK
ncbi:hypothetical protein [Candidatus Uabimicrobium sp. HlEnr_7]|uniref:hypothetical protein n=1 Tax=Candidatus Uabimicrobium helgolandensis TaxID=3095367 RepID=UPI00355705B0